MNPLIDELAFDEALERTYFLGDAAEKAGDVRAAARYFRVAADQHIGDAAVRAARALFALGEIEEATHWCQEALADGFAEASELVEDNARQRFLEHAARISVGAPVYWQPDAAPSVSRIELADVARVSAHTQALRTLDWQYGGIVSHTPVLEHLARVEPLVLAEGARTEMCSAVAEVAELAGWTAFDSGLPGLALPHFALALTLARQAENERLIASVLSRAGRMFLHHNAADDAVKAFQLGSVAAHNWSTSELLAKVDQYSEERVRARTITLTTLARNHLTTGDAEVAGEFTAKALAVSANLRSTRADDHLRLLSAEALAAGLSPLVEQIAARFARPA